ncbi:AraC family transcriptional regulator [Streptomyces fulvoviolaceus]|uniref:AraC family transcriptional regulator n=1 Tax=Streptomyces fulvoviolaceus TaxID=285535 RepID=UPI0004C4D410|nr:AraC family transcriptional regulator [Streptomyces fulvoviolaceus]MCT9078718.1 AraC family transcriptional regulator [Streptomyces fulvoviolaceus]
MEAVEAVGEDRVAEFSLYTTRSLEESRAAIAAHYYDLRLEVAGATADFSTNMTVVDLGALTVGDVSFGTEIRMGFGEPGFYHVGVPLEGCCSVQQGRGDAVFGTTRRALFFDPERDIRVDAWSADCHVLTVKIDKAAVHHQLELLLGRPVPRSPSFEPCFDVTRGPGRSWARLAHWSLLERDVSHGLLRSPLIRGRLEQTLLEGVLLAADHSCREELAAPPPPMRPASVKRVMDVVQERPAEPYDAARLAEIAQVSVRTLQEAFRRHVGMSPMAYVNEVRLQRVRGQLRASAPGTTTVSDVAYQWGFAHLGRFARRYRERFGESPSQTLRAA